MKAILILLVLLISGCGPLATLERDINIVNKQYQDITFQLPSTDRYVIVQLSSESIEDIVSVDIHEGSNKISIPTLVEQTAVIYLFPDESRDLIYQPQEKLYRIDAKDLVGDNPTIIINESMLSFESVKGLETVPLLDYIELELNRANIGRIVPLDHEMFGDEAKYLGMWNPLEFVERRYSGLIFMQPYDPNKIPVLFVHGMGASGSDFEAIINQMDKERYQAWVVNYPTALSLTLVAHSLSAMVSIAREDYNADTPIHIVAHSMGGVLTQHFLNICSAQERCDKIHSFTSISSPFAGVNSAQLGVEMSPVVMPSWKDIAPNSTTIKNLFNQDLAANKPPHYLMFAYDNGRVSGNPSGDGTIALSSQLTPFAQQQAEQMSGYNESHTSVLTNPQLVSDLAKFWQQTEAGRIK
ncbi:alpha/beta hydrolase [Vibrio lamellibrachiae]|uniref:esterase/lipase family protein n=1 Tax=Vibrio lamellibrachiae TaxID=2910253 RepID=UPI003D11A41E